VVLLLEVRIAKEHENALERVARKKKVQQDSAAMRSATCSTTLRRISTPTARETAPRAVLVQ
jgi:hypothetical protein